MTCSLCDGRDGDEGACVERTLVFNGSDGEPGARVATVDPVPYGAEPMFDGRVPTRPCPDCGVTAGNYHHEDCTREICPVCGEQLVRCPCQPGVVAGGSRDLEVA